MSTLSNFSVSGLSKGHVNIHNNLLFFLDFEGPFCCLLFELLKWHFNLD